jgi:ascorbate-specific PTS system EIIC-type component UlaA
MLKFYKYLYIVIYRWNYRFSGDNGVPQLNALIGISFILLFSLMVLALLVSLMLNSTVITNYQNVKGVVSGAAIVSFVINYLVFSYKEKYRIIDNEFGAMNDTQRRNWSVGVLAYMICLFSILIYLSILAKK